MVELKGSDARQGQALNLGDGAYQELKEQLVRGVFRPGDRLTVRSVAEALKVSSTPARDAINRLVTDKALVYAGPKTVIVPVLTDGDLREITLIRIALERLAAEAAMASLQASDVEKLNDIQCLINDGLAQKSYGDALRHNKDFHFFIYERSKLPHLVALIEAQWLRVGPAFYDLYPDFAENRQGVRNHEMVMQSIIDGDAGALAAAFESDIRDGYHRLRSALKRNARDS